MTGSLLCRLRRETHDKHEALHVHPLMKHFFRGFDHGVYLGFLSSFVKPWQEFHARLEEDKMSDVASRWPDLKLDLELLGHPIEPSPGAPTRNAGAILGSAYVLVGASRGARSLRKHVLQQMPETPTHFLDPSSSDASWDIVKSMVAESAAEGPVADEALTNAKAVFAQVATAMDFAWSTRERSARSFTNT